MKKSNYLKQLMLVLLALLLVQCQHETIDDIAPTIVLEGETDMKHVLNEPFVEPGFYVMKNFSTVALDTAVTVSKIDVNKAGLQVITYKVVDEHGNEGSASRNVMVYNEAEVLEGKHKATIVKPYPGTAPIKIEQYIVASKTENNKLAFIDFCNNEGLDLEGLVERKTLDGDVIFFEIQSSGDVSIEVVESKIRSNGDVFIEYKETKDLTTVEAQVLFEKL